MLRNVKFFLGALMVTAFFVRPAPAAAVTNGFGFSGKEVYPVDQQITQLHVADIDGDGLNDLIVVNNLRAKINLLYNLTGKTNRADAKPARKLEINELPPDARFRVDSIPSDERIAALAVTDLNGDGKPDLVYFGDAKDLIVLYNRGTNGWSEPKRWHIDDGRLDANALSVGDLNGDGLPDIALLGDNGAVHFLAQSAAKGCQRSLQFRARIRRGARGFFTVAPDLFAQQAFGTLLRALHSVGARQRRQVGRRGGAFAQ